MKNNIEIPRLYGSKIYLRKVVRSDICQNYVDWLNDPEVNQYLETRHEEQTLNKLINYWDTRQLDSLSPWLAIVNLMTDEHIGNIKLGPINWIHKRADISIFIGNKDCWGKGIAQEAINLVKVWAFESLGLKKLYAGAYVVNIGSIKAFQKCGFVIEGTFKNDAILNNGRVNSVRLGILNDN